MAGRYCSPASTTVTKAISEEEREQRAINEEKLKGASDKLNEVPEWIDELAQEYYKYIISELEISGLLCNLDVFIVAQTAQALADIEELTRTLNNEGYIIQSYDKNGNHRLDKHPAYAMRDTAHKQFKSLAMQLGLSPSARASLGNLQLQNRVDEADPVLQALKGLND